MFQVRYLPLDSSQGPTSLLHLLLQVIALYFLVLGHEYLNSMNPSFILYLLSTIAFLILSHVCSFTYFSCGSRMCPSCILLSTAMALTMIPDLRVYMNELLFTNSYFLCSSPLDLDRTSGSWNCKPCLNNLFLR